MKPDLTPAVTRALEYARRLARASGAHVQPAHWLHGLLRRRGRPARRARRAGRPRLGRLRPRPSCRRRRGPLTPPGRSRGPRASPCRRRPPGRGCSCPARPRCPATCCWSPCSAPTTPCADALKRWACAWTVWKRRSCRSRGRRFRWRKKRRRTRRAASTPPASSTPAPTAPARGCASWRIIVALSSTTPSCAAN